MTAVAGSAVAGRAVAGTAGAGTAPAPVASEPEQESRLLRAMGRWWRDERPAWTEESWWDCTLQDDVRRLLWLTPGPLLVAALADAPAGGPCPIPHAEDRMLPGWPTPGHAPGWPCACQIVVAAAWDACASWLAARAARALVDAAGPEPIHFALGPGERQIHDPAREELAHALRSSIPAMGNRVGAARALVEHPDLVALVESAAISAWAGRLMLDRLDGLDRAQAGAVIADVASRVHQRLVTGRRPYHSAEVNRLARAARLRICPETAHQARVRSFATRRVVVHPRCDGMATLVADLAETDAYRIHRRLSAIAAGLQADAVPEGEPETRTRDQLRADVLADLLLGAGASPARPESGDDGVPAAPSAGHAPARPPVRPDIQVIITLGALLGLAQDPAEVPGLGPIPADVARALAADGRWTAWIADAAGAVTATGSARYVPTSAVARLVRAREPDCRFPGCRQASTRCDLDHAIPWPRGSTTPENLGPLCRRHHRLKTHGGWALDPQTGPGTVTWRWRTPAGLTVRDGPEPPLPGRRAADSRATATVRPPN